MAEFDRLKERGYLLSNVGVPMLLEFSLDEANADHSVAYWALSCFGNAVQAALCDLDDEYDQLLSRANDWLHYAIEHGEVPVNSYFPNYHEVECRHVLAVIKWLKTGLLDQELINAACEFLKRYFVGKKDKVRVAHNLSTFALAGKWQELQTCFRNCRTLQPPTTDQAIKCPGKISYLFANHALFGVPNLEELERAFRSFITYKIPVCLGARRNGLGIWRDVPTWTLLEEVHFAGSSIGGAANIRRALSYVRVTAGPAK